MTTKINRKFVPDHGVFVALEIAISKKDYFEAFQYSLSKVLTDKESILQELDKYQLDLSNLKDRISNDDGTEWGNIVTTGSPLYTV